MTTSIEHHDRAWLEVNLAAVVRNASRIAALVGRPLLAMLKADGYGLGAVAVSRALEPIAPWGFGVATIEEGATLRTAGVERPIVVFTPMLPEEAPRLAFHGLRPVIGDLEALDAWQSAGGNGAFHVEIDTGMSRSGFRWHDTGQLDALRPRLAGAAGWEGVFTHFHSSDTDAEATNDQWDRFEEIVASLPGRPPLVHAANSAACAFGERYAADLVRPGIFLYGGRAGTLEPEPVAALRGRVVALRRLRIDDSVSYDAEAVVEHDTTIATIAIGYADGVPRTLGNGGPVELNSAVMRIAGRVTMDMVMVDTGGAEVAVGDTATLFGGLVALDDQAAQAGTNTYELLTRVTARVPRRYVEGEPRDR
ncbi:MAG: alanine racemase [Gemmatimonadales bacterium]